MEAGNWNATLLEYRLRVLIDRTSYKPDTGFRVTIKGECVFVQHWQKVSDCKTGQPSFQKGRKFYVSPHMTDGEIVRTLALAVKLFEEHEANEWLRFDGQRVLNPHPEGARP